MKDPSEPGKPPVPELPELAGLTPDEDDDADDDDAEFESMQRMVRQVGRQHITLPPVRVPVTDGHARAAFDVAPQRPPAKSPTVAGGPAVVVRDLAATTVLVERPTAPPPSRISRRASVLAAVGLGVGLVGSLIALYPARTTPPPVTSGPSPSTPVVAIPAPPRVEAWPAPPRVEGLDAPAAQAGAATSGPLPAPSIVASNTESTAAPTARRPIGRGAQHGLPPLPTPAAHPATTDAPQAAASAASTTNANPVPRRF